MKKIIPFIALLLCAEFLFAQNEIELNSSGLVLPRLTTEQRDALLPIEGQVIYNIDSKVVEHFIVISYDSLWISASEALVNKALSSLFIFSEEYYNVSTNQVDSITAGLISLNGVPAYAFIKDTTYDGKLLFSYNEGNIVIHADPHDRTPGTQGNYEDNIFIGADAGHPLLEGDQNVMIGTNAGSGSRQRRNVVLGYGAGASQFQNTDNTIIGNRAGTDISGDDNVVIGSNAGDGTFGARNILIGAHVGSGIVGTEELNNALIIESGENEDPLILGDFAENLLTLNAKVGIGIENSSYPLHVHGFSTEGPLLNITDGSSTKGGLTLQAVPTSIPELRDFRIVNKEPGGLSLGTNGDLLMRLAPDGNIGIGEDDPETKLQIVGGTDVNNSAGGFLTLGALNARNMGIDQNEIQARDDGGATTLFLNAGGGDVGIGTTGPTETLDVDGTLRVRDIPQSITGFQQVGVDPAGRISVQLSDRRLKKDIKPIKHALSKIKAIDGVSYLAISEEYGAAGERQLGVIAQTVQEVVPDAIFEREGYLGVNYSELIPVLINAVKEQQAQIEKLEDQVTLLSSNKLGIIGREKVSEAKLNDEH